MAESLWFIVCGSGGAIDKIERAKATGWKEG